MMQTVGEVGLEAVSKGRDVQVSVRQQLLREAIDSGLTLGEVLNAFASRASDYEARLAAKARAEHHKDGELEIDDNAVCSVGDESEGGYVLAWVWVQSPEQNG